MGHRSHDHLSERGRSHRQRHRARRGAVRAAILTLLDERSMHGYELITELDQRSGGRWRPSPGAIYPALGRLEDEGLLTSTEDDGKRRFTLTDRGREALAELRRRQGDEASAPWDDPGTGRRGDLRRQVVELVSQVRQIGRFGSPDQVDRAGTVLADTTRRLYQILASPEEAPPAAAGDPGDGGEGTDGGAGEHD